MARYGGAPSTPRRRIPAGPVVVAAVVIGGSVGIWVNQDDSPVPVNAPIEGVSAPSTVAQGVLLRDGFEGEGGGGAPVPACPEPPPGWVRVQKSWSQLFSPNGTTPIRLEFASQSWPAPLPFVQRDQYSMTPIRIDVPNKYVNLFFDQVQTKAPWYTVPRPAEGMFVSISDCPDDLRAPTSYQDPNPFLRPGCRMYENQGSLSFGTLQGSGCPIPLGKTVYLHFISANPAGGITPGESSCHKPAGGCDVGVVTGGN